MKYSILPLALPVLSTSLEVRPVSLKVPMRFSIYQVSFFLSSCSYLLMGGLCFMWLVDVGVEKEVWSL